MTALRLIVTAAACALLSVQALGDAPDPQARRSSTHSAAAFQFDGPEASGVKDGTRIALTDRSVDDLSTATKSPSATRPLHGGTVTTPVVAAHASTTEGRSGSLPFLEVGALLLAGLLAVVSVSRRRNLH